MKKKATGLNFSSITRLIDNIVERKFTVIFVGAVIVSYIGLYTYHNSLIEQSDKRLKEIQEQLDNSDIHNKMTTIQKENEKLKQAYVLQKDKYRTFEKLIKDLERCRHPKVTLGVGYSESNLKYNIKHPTTDTSGIGGFKLGYWRDELNKYKINTNSLKAIDHIYTVYLKSSPNKDQALKNYKGTISNYKSYIRTKRLIASISDRDVKKVIYLHKTINNLIL